MAHFAELDSNNVVLRVLVVSDAEEYKGSAYLSDECALGGRWVQTSYTRRIRKHFAGVGMFYDEVKDAFIHPQPYPSWILNDETLLWEAPIAPPLESEFIFIWNEENQEWVETDIVFQTPPNLVIDDKPSIGF